MKKCFAAVLLSLVLCAAGCGRQQPVQSEPADLEAVIISDLHYTDGRSVSVMPLSAYLPEVCETLCSEVTDIHPDVFIMTGDNTNSGRKEEIAGLLPYLEKIREAGIRLILIPGNHDMYGSAEEFRNLYFPLLEPLSEDAETLSYTAEAGNVLFLAMDDSSCGQGGNGYYPESTMHWLEKQLQEAEKKGQMRVVLSHYSLLSDYGTGYQIDNPGLKAMLEKYHVQLFFSGHQHTQNILAENDLHEVISASVLALPCLAGRLSVHENHISYRAEPLDFETYGPEGFADTVRLTAEESEKSRNELFAGIIEQHISDPEERKQTLDLISLVLTSVSEGSLHENYERICSDPAFELMNESLAGTNYGPWIAGMLKEKPVDASALELERKKNDFSRSHFL